MAKRKLSTVFKELDEIAHQLDHLAAEFTGEGVFDRVKRGLKNLQQPPAENPYQILDLDPSCIPSDIVYAYRQLAARFHPDNKRTGDVAMFKKVTAAYEELCRQRGIK